MKKSIIILLSLSLLLLNCSKYKIEKVPKRKESTTYSPYIVVDKTITGGREGTYFALILKDYYGNYRVGTSNAKYYYEKYILLDTVYYKEGYWKYLLTKKEYNKLKKDEQNKDK